MGVPEEIWGDFEGGFGGGRVGFGALRTFGEGFGGIWGENLGRFERKIEGGVMKIWEENSGRFERRFLGSLVTIWEEDFGGI